MNKQLQSHVNKACSSICWKVCLCGGLGAPSTKIANRVALAQILTVTVAVSMTQNQREYRNVGMVKQTGVGASR